MKAGPIIFCLGLMMLVVGMAYSMVTVNIDATAPQIIINEYYGSIPENTASYIQLNKIYCWVYEPDSTITSVVCTIDSIDYPLTYETSGGTANQYLKYSYTVTSTDACDDIGSHAYAFKATNDHGLTGTSSGTYSMQDDLDGSWYINNIQIFSTDQIVKLSTNTLEFVFVVSSGVPEIAFVDYTGPETGHLGLTEESSTRWSATKTFSDGVYSMTLEVSDYKGGLIRFSVFGMAIGDIDWDGDLDWDIKQLSTAQWLTWGGLATTGIGVVVTVLQRKKPQSR